MFQTNKPTPFEISTEDSDIYVVACEKCRRATRMIYCCMVDPKYTDAYNSQSFMVCYDCFLSRPLHVENFDCL